MKITALAHLIKVAASPAYNAWREAHPNYNEDGANAYVNANIENYLRDHPNTKRHVADATIRNEYWHPAGWEQWKPGQPQMTAPAVSAPAAPRAPAPAPAAPATAPAAPAPAPAQAAQTQPPAGAPATSPKKPL